MSSMQEHNNAGPSGTRHSSDHGSETAVSVCSVCTYKVKINLKLAPGSQRNWATRNESFHGYYTSSDSQLLV